MKTIAEHIKPFIDHDFGRISDRALNEVLIRGLDPTYRPRDDREAAILEMQDYLIEFWAD